MTTMSSSSEPSAPVAEASGQKIRGPLRRLLITLIPANLVLFAIYGAVPQVLLPIQVGNLGARDKVIHLAIVTTVGAFAAMIAQPIAGQISDRTRSRFGRRAPWIVMGALIAGLAMVGIGLANGLWEIAIAWAIAQIAYNFAQGPVSAFIPDRVPAWALGTFAAVSGGALMFGAVGGVVLAPAFAKQLPVGYIFFGGLALIVLTLFVVFNREDSSKDAPRDPFVLLDFLRTFWVNPIAHPDFFFAFAGRLLLYAGYFSVTGYNLYILEDYVGLGKSGAVAVFSIVAALSLAGIIPGIIVSGILSDKLGRRKIFVFISSVLVGIGLLIPMLSPTLGAMMAMSVVAGLGFGAFQSVDQAVINQVLPNKAAYAKDLGVVNIAATFPQAIAPAIGGVIVATFHYVAIFPIGILLSVLGAFAVWFIKAVK